MEPRSAGYVNVSRPKPSMNDSHPQTDDTLVKTFLENALSFYVRLKETATRHRVKNLPLWNPF